MIKSHLSNIVVVQEARHSEVEAAKTACLLDRVTLHYCVPVLNSGSELCVGRNQLPVAHGNPTKRVCIEIFVTFWHYFYFRVCFFHDV